MPKVILAELVQGSHHPIASIFLKYANELEIVVRRDNLGNYHYLIYVGFAKNAMKSFRSLLVEMLLFRDESRSHKLNPCQPRYWPDGDSDNPKNRYYAVMSFVRLLGNGDICESAHFFISRKGFDIASKYAIPIGWNDYE
jgi:hypothetical protein